MTLQIPSRFHSSLKKLSKLEPSSISALAKQFAALVPTFDLDSLAVQLASVNLSAEEINELVSLLISLFKVSDAADIGLEEFIQDVCESASEVLENDEDSAKLSENLRALLVRENAIGITAKAMDVFTEHDHSFRSCRVLTDLRPVFSSRADYGDEKIVAAMATHTLKVEYTESAIRKEFFISMDSNDIRLMLKALERALAKENVLKELVDRQEFAYMDVDILEDS